MPHPAAGQAGGRSRTRGLRVFTAADVDELTARAGLGPARRRKVRAAAAVLGSAVTSYVADELIDWSAAPDDPIYRLTFPDEDALDGTAQGGDLPRPGEPGSRVDMPGPAHAGSGAGRPGLGEPVLPGVYRSYHDTVSVLAPSGLGGRSYGITCPGRAWSAADAGPALAAADVPRLVAYLAAHPEVSIVEFTGADALIMSAAALRRYLEPLLEAEHLPPSSSSPRHWRAGPTAS